MLKLGFEGHVSVIRLEFVMHLYSSVVQSGAARFGSNTRERDFRGAPCVVTPRADITQSHSTGDSRGTERRCSEATDGEMANGLIGL